MEESDVSAIAKASTGKVNKNIPQLKVADL
jgi:hypothetical protein